MLFRGLNGRERDISYIPYLIDWDPAREVSAPQGRVKAFLRPYWQNDCVLEEAKLIPDRKRLRFDLINLSKQIVVEVSPEQHSAFNPFFHGSVAGFRASLKRDLSKSQWAELNGFTFCELVSEDLAQPLTAKLFAERFGLIL